MSLFTMKTQDLSWQDRTINVELMMAPARTQLLYNKHKGLKTKYNQEHSNLEREKSSYLRGYKTDQRLMERKKELYAKRRNDIILRRSSGHSRTRSIDNEQAGRVSAPPRLQDNSANDGVFLTQIRPRESKSADVRLKTDSVPVQSQKKSLPPVQISNHITPDANLSTASPNVSSRTPTPGKPHLERQKNVRFYQIQIDEKPEEEEENAQQEISIEDRIKNFINSQEEFNSRRTFSPTCRGSDYVPEDNKVLLARRYSGLQISMRKLENAFDEFCVDGTTEGLHKLVKFATKMRAHVRTARNSSIVPPVMTMKGSMAFKKLTSSHKPLKVSGE